MYVCVCPVSYFKASVRFIYSLVFQRFLGMHIQAFLFNRSPFVCRVSPSSDALRPLIREQLATAPAPMGPPAGRCIKGLQLNRALVRRSNRISQKEIIVWRICGTVSTRSMSWQTQRNKCHRTKPMKPQRLAVCTHWRQMSAVAARAD